MKLPNPMLVVYLLWVVLPEGDLRSLGVGHMWASDPGIRTASLAYCCAWGSTEQIQPAGKESHEGTSLFSQLLETQVPTLEC